MKLPPAASVAAAVLALFACSTPAAVAQDAEGTCAQLGDRSQQCGADSPDRPATCCAGLKCPDRGGVRCEADVDATGGPGDVDTGRPTQGEEVAGTVAAGDITVQGTAFSSTMNSRVIIITVPEGTPKKGFVMMVR